MAFDFPASPSMNQTVTFGTTTYQWNGQAWMMQSGNVGPQGPEGPVGPQGIQGTPGPVGGVTIEVGDTPPSNPADKSMFWESDTGALWLRYPDPTGEKHWVQVNSNLILPPQDGGEYVMVNGLWRLKSQTLIMDGVIAQNVAVPSGARFVKAQGSIYQSTTAANSISVRASLDGANFMQAANDYNHSGFIHYAASTTVAGLTGAYTQAYLTYNNNQVVIANVFDMRLGLIRTAANARWDINVVGSCYGASGWSTNVSRVEIMETNAGSNLVIKALQFSLITALCGPGSTIDVEWVY